MISIKEMAVIVIVHVGGFLLATTVLLGGNEGQRSRTGAPYAGFAPEPVFARLLATASVSPADLSGSL